MYGIVVYTSIYTDETQKVKMCREPSVDQGFLVIITSHRALSGTSAFSLSILIR